MQFGEALRLLGIEHSIELTSVADLPSNSGLGSSSSFTVALLNANLVYQVPRYPIDLSLGFYNILDQHYDDPGGAEHLQDRIQQDRFTFRVQLGYGF